MSADQVSRGTTRPSVPSTQGDGRPATEDRERLRADVERVRAQLGETVAALASKADVKTRAKNATRRMEARVTGKTRQMVQTGRRKVAPAAKHARPSTADEPATSGRTAPALVRGGVVAGGVAAGAVSVVVWLRRRRDHRPDRWQQTVRTARQAGEQLRGTAAGVAAKGGDVAARTAAKGQAAASKAGSRAGTAAGSPAAKITAQAAVPVAATVIAAWWLRRRRAGRRNRA